MKYLPNILEWLLYLLASACIVAACAVSRGAQPVLREPVEDRVDIIWREHFYDGEGRLVFTQDIFVVLVEYSSVGLVEEIVAWRMNKHPDQIVMRDEGGFCMLWQDGERLRLVRATSYRETWSQVDSELLGREKLPPDERRGLRYEKSITTNPPFVREWAAEGP